MSRSNDIHERWIVFVSTDDRSGALTALAEMFSSRGVSFTSFSTLTVTGGAGLMSILFRASERLARVLARTLQRLAVTRSVTLHRASDAGLRAVAVVHGAVPDAPRGVAVTAAGWDGDGTILTGAFADVEAALAELDPDGIRQQALTVLPPVA